MLVTFYLGLCLEVSFLALGISVFCEKVFGIGQFMKEWDLQVWTGRILGFGWGEGMRQKMTGCVLEGRRQGVEERRD